MKTFLFILTLLAGLFARAQYYYKDIIGTKESTGLIKNYRINKVQKVIITSYDENNTKYDDFYAEQIFDAGSRILKTTTRSGLSDPSVLISYADADGHVVKTIDSSEVSTSTTVYNYSAEGLLQTVISSSSDTAMKSAQSEQHIWQYVNDKIAGMLRIKGIKDTTYITFKYDKAGNITEENSMRRGIMDEPVHYYYDSTNRLTDIVRFSPKAQRLLPEYIFAYSSSDQVIQKITVPANSSDYLIWRYQYNNKGLKIKEAIYNKHKQLVGKVEYAYVNEQ